MTGRDCPNDIPLIKLGAPVESRILTGDRDPIPCALDSNEELDAPRILSLVRAMAHIS